MKEKHSFRQWLTNWMPFFLPLCLILGVFFLKTSLEDKSLEASYPAFEKWMRFHKYDERLIDIYRCQYQDPFLRRIIDDYFKIRQGRLRHPKESAEGYQHFKKDTPLVVRFIEVVPTDPGVEWTQVRPEDLERFARYLQERFGKKILLKHVQLRLDYRKNFGDFFHFQRTLFSSGIPPKIDRFLFSFEPPCLVRFDAETIGHQAVPDLWDIGHCGIFMGRDLRLTGTVASFDAYAHEFGHNVGLDHQFVDPENPPRHWAWRPLLKREEGRFVGIDDVMIKRPPVNKEKGHGLSPLSRYALEPDSGYLDDENFGEAYGRFYSRFFLENAKKCACRF